MHFDLTSALGGMTILGIVAHAVNSFPQQTNPYAKWLLGIVQYVVGQRLQAQQTISAGPMEKNEGAK